MSRLRFHRRLQGDLLCSVADKPGGRALDLGCGPGGLLEEGAHLPGWIFLGLDADRRMLREASVVAPGGLIQALAQELPFADGSFDAVASVLVMHHLSSAEKRLALQEAWRALRPGGELHVADRVRPSSPVYALAFHLVRVVDGYERTSDHAAGRVADLLAGAGFEGVEERRRFDAWIGTIGVFRARKPA